MSNSGTKIADAAQHGTRNGSGFSFTLAVSIVLKPQPRSFPTGHRGAGE